MMTFISFLLVVLAVLVAIPVAVLIIEVIAAIALPQRNSLAAPGKDDFRQRVAVLVPAHNESTNLLPTLTDIKAQLRTCDRLLVVADNCSDDTASVATAAGANVIERSDQERRGKGYALDWGLRHMSGDPPEIVVMVDADCRLAAFTIDQLATACAMTHRPVQAVNLMISSDESPINSRVAEFAWRVKNLIRPMGLRALGLPCQLMGTGMAFPWDVIHSADLASGRIVEDLKLGFDLALVGSPPIFNPFAGVTSYFPHSREGVQSQRQRWEQGHLEMIFSTAPRLIAVGILRADPDLLALAFDLAVPPLALLALLATGIWLVTGCAAVLGISSAAVFVSSVSLFAFVAAIFISWLKYGRDILPPRSFPLVILYVIGKFSVYRRILFRKFSSDWIRTDRTKP